MFVQKMGKIMALKSLFVSSWSIIGSIKIQSVFDIILSDLVTYTFSLKLCLLKFNIDQ